MLLRLLAILLDFLTFEWYLRKKDITVKITCVLNYEVLHTALKK